MPRQTLALLVAPALRAQVLLPNTHLGSAAGGERQQVWLWWLGGGLRGGEWWSRVMPRGAGPPQGSAVLRVTVAIRGDTLHMVTHHTELIHWEAALREKLAVHWPHRPITSTHWLAWCMSFTFKERTLGMP